MFFVTIQKIYNYSLGCHKSTTMNNYMILVLGVLSVGIGGELFVRGVIGLAHWARVSAGIIGATVVVIGTSIPELATTIISA